MKFKMLSLLLASGIVLAACGNDDDDQKNTNNTDNDTKTEQTTDNNQNSDDNDDQNTNQNAKTQTIDVKDVQTKPEDAIKTAKSSFDGDVRQVEYKKENGQWVYDIDLRNNNEEAEVKVSDKDNKVLNTNKEKEMDNDNDKTINYGDAIDFKEAVKKAQDQQKGDLKKWSLDNDDGQFVYNIELMTDNGEQELVLDAKSGEVLQQEND
ncbi:PepSY domain-containing protein [Staphylococcus delphini]|uniref:PepSY domain-containing protein n=2 Tax=Staphylococcus delphini TaxID=53344 RepID=UPI0023B325F6|nr:PepSY domain-containing protein [Staphylococcus delphini]MDE9752743.1 PepSY domain-containing protein [Staphylococcus delphini]MDE9789786.1 PepSY domain-containing protein [Staphylococcus delphini]MDE9792988.1 PepSY domain-containing protein [Staphylococcus delphini]MDE9796535.1 PepSY domain-containing protein [Staphylococcus delphini]